METFGWFKEEYDKVKDTEEFRQAEREAELENIVLVLADKLNTKQFKKREKIIQKLIDHANKLGMVTNELPTLRTTNSRKIPRGDL